MTKSEVCLWKYVLSKKQMKGYPFRRQRPVLNYIADFFCLPLGLIIEVDGITHHDDSAIAYDTKREKILRNAGYALLRFSAREVLQEINMVRKTIEVWIEDREQNNPS